MAATAGLYGIGKFIPGPDHPVGVKGRFYIPDDHTEGLVKLSCRILKDRGLPAAGRPDDVYCKNSVLIKELSVLRRDLIVLFIGGYTDLLFHVTKL